MQSMARWLATALSGRFNVILNLPESVAANLVQGQKVVIKGHREGLMMNVIMKEYRVTSVSQNTPSAIPMD
jgi:hypothetical protein